MTNKIGIFAIGIIISLNGCSNKSNQYKKEELSSPALKTVINYDNNVKSKVVAPTALKATIYPIKDDSSGSFTDKQDVYFWVSKAKFRNEKKTKEIEVDSKIQKFLED